MTTQQQLAPNASLGGPASPPPSGSKRNIPWIPVLTLVGGVVTGIGSTLYADGELRYRNALNQAQSEKAQELSTLTVQLANAQSRADRAEELLKQANEQLAAKKGELAIAGKEVQRLQANSASAPNCAFVKKRLDRVDADIADITYVSEFRLEGKDITAINTPEKTEKLAALRKEQEFLLKQVSTCR
ncbi:hypothetical protein [Herbaspirillum sp. CAH-3]|uniref:hypothetical protein n=1 Tax=Herbaspirillum sp. CAH-3 TaxID=2605746 RepID=UPI0012AC9FC7|nr:hypothetical protein [Herbaspirillum sp. CAH-3]MRT30446.1 hypothetical protein [Herbaspirillum sp. CAH-3]